MKFISYLDSFLTFVILIKIAFLLTAISNEFAKRSKNDKIRNNLQPKLEYWKQRLEFIFLVSMAVLLILYFRPGSELQVYGKSRTLFFLFGIVLLFTANWAIFIKESALFKLLSNILSV